MNEYPDEIRDYPRPVVALVGCSSLHASVTKHLGTRPDISGKEVCAFNILSYEETSALQSARRRKERRLNYDGYTAGGILKTQWLYKHRNIVPSVVVALFIWEEEKVWKNKENDICVELENIRKGLKNRSTKILLVLVHRQNFVDAQQDERISSLKKRGDLDSRNIVLFDKDNMPESTKKLDKFLLEFSRYYYKEEARRYKKDIVKSSITRTSLFMLNVRHYFKVGYFAEFRRDPRATLKYYNLAYTSLRDFAQLQSKGNDKYRLYEIKAIAETINFQICKYYLSLGNLNDGVAQFQKHMKVYRPLVGLAELEFHHVAWISRQNLVFGQVLEALAAQQLPNISKYSNSHPAYYYQAAAKFSIDRKKLATKLCESMRGSEYFEKFCEQYQVQSSSNNLFADISISTGTNIPIIPLPTAILSLAPTENNQITYIGQVSRPPELQFFDDNNNTPSVPPSPVITPLSASNIGAVPPQGTIPNPLMAPPTPTTPSLSSSMTSSTINNNVGPSSPAVSIDYSDFIQRSLAVELFTDHSSIIVDLLTKAYEQYKSPKSNRMILHTAALMGHEYFSQQKYLVAKKFFDRICKSYRSEGWWDLLTNILNMSLHCARHLGLVKDYVVYTLELIHTKMTNSIEEKQQLQNNIMKIISEPSSVASTTAMHLDSPVIIPMCYNHALIGVKVQFREPSVYAKSQFNFTCKVLANFPLKVQFSRLRIEFSDPIYDTEITPTHDPSVHNKNENQEDTENRLLFFPGKAKSFHFNFMSKEKMELQCTKIIMELGNSPSCIRFEWNVTEWPSYRVSDDTNGQLFHERTQTKILAHEAKLLLNIIHHPPALIQEYYHFQLKLRNKGEKVLNGTINLELLPATGEGMPSPFYTDIDSNTPVSTLAVPEIAPEGEFMQDLYYHVNLNTVIPSHDIQLGTDSRLIPTSISNSIISKKISVKITYMTDAQYIAHTDRTFEVPVQSPVTNQFTLFSSHLQPISTNSGNVLMGQPFFLSADVQCNPTYGLQLIRASLLLNKAEKRKEVATCVATSNVPTQEHGLTKEGTFSLWYKLVPNVTGESVELGCLEMEWKRSQHGHLSQVHDESSPSVDDSLTSVCQFPIPPIKINSAPFSVKIDVPSFAVVGGVFPVTFLLHNHTDLLQEFSLAVTENNSFLFSGPKSMNSFCIHPHSNYTLKYSLIPLTAGRQPLPNFQILSKRLNQELIQAKPTRYVFVNPSHWSQSKN